MYLPSPSATSSNANSLQGNFLSWHRYYTWAFERVLQTECGYNGTQPVSLLDSLAFYTVD